MEASFLVGKIIRSVWTYPWRPVAEAWVDELTTKIATSAAFLELVDGKLIEVRPGEVTLPDERYPALGLGLTFCTRESVRMTQPSGAVLDIEPLAEARDVLPLVVASVEELDPLQEGAVSQISLIGANGQSLVFRHIMPPMTLGICVEFGQST